MVRIPTWFSVTAFLILDLIARPIPDRPPEDPNRLKDLHRKCIAKYAALGVFCEDML